MLVVLTHFSKTHTWLLPVFAVGLGAPRWCQMLWGTSSLALYIPWAGSGGPYLGISLWLWLGVLDAVQGVGLGMILLQVCSSIKHFVGLLTPNIFRPYHGCTSVLHLHSLKSLDRYVSWLRGPPLLTVLVRSLSSLMRPSGISRKVLKVKDELYLSLTFHKSLVLREPNGTSCFLGCTCMSTYYCLGILLVLPQGTTLFVFLFWDMRFVLTYFTISARPWLGSNVLSSLLG